MLKRMRNLLADHESDTEVHMMLEQSVLGLSRGRITTWRRKEKMDSQKTVTMLPSINT